MPPANIVGSGDYTYAVEEDWDRLPDGYPCPTPLQPLPYPPVIIPRRVNCPSSSADCHECWVFRQCDVLCRS